MPEDRYKRYRVRQEDKDHVRVHPWVPADQMQGFLTLAAALRARPSAREAAEGLQRLLKRLDNDAT